MKNIKDKQFGYLTAIRSIKEKKKPLKILCKCICGKELVVARNNLTNQKSCGCKTKEIRKESSTTHGMTNTSEFRLWSKLKGFCYNPNHKNYPQYGGKGVIICTRWLENFMNFLSDVGKKPSETFTLYRINENGNFEPSNCKWSEIDKIKTNINLTKNLSKKRIDLTGQKFDRLTVISFSHIDKHKEAHWLCKCSCGNTCTPSNRSLRNGGTKSCGCLHKELLSQRYYKHGKSNTREYYIWNNIRERCFNPKNSHYSYYGGRGIKVCDHWLEFSNFINDMGIAPKGYSIERKDYNGNYEPSNCEWIPLPAQGSNKRNNHMIEYNGKRLHVEAWSRELGVKNYQLKHLLHVKKLFLPDAIAELKRKGKCFYTINH